MVSILIVGWNSAADLEACLDALYLHAPARPFEVIYVDNASSDGSAQRVRRAFPAVRVLENDRNAGFQRANNQALRVARGDVLVLLNPDTQALRGSFDTLIAFLDEHPDVAAVSPRCVFPDGRLQWSTAPFPTLAVLRHWFWSEHAQLARWLGRHVSSAAAPADPPTQEQAYAYGACLAVKRAAVEEVGPMDEGFFLTGGEVAWCREMQRHGWKTYYVAEAAVVHRESASRARRRWISELDWVLAHRRLLYLYEGITDGMRGDLYFSLHLLLFAASGLARRILRPFGASRRISRSAA
jgi:N-acetylglucosaminyl-diphospho-decaprenol L-rhamnosyltransferase